MTYLDATVTRVVRGKFVMQLLLALDGAPLPAWRAGAHVLLEVAASRWRPGWLCQPPGATRECRLAMPTRADGAHTAFVQQVVPGDRVRIQPPREHFVLASTARRHLLLGAGIGIAPLASMAYQLHADGQDFQFMIAGAARNQAPLAEVLHAAPFVHRVTWCPAAPPGRCRPEPAGHVHTWPTWIHATLAAEPADAHLYACGPRPFIAAVLDAARQLEWDERRLHRQHLGLVPPDTELGPPFDVVLSRHGLHLHVPADRTLAEMLQAHGIDVPTVCGVGVCGACLVPVRDGGIDHRDYLKGADRRSGNRMAACCSRAASGILVLDL